MPVRLHCGSASTRITRWPRSASIHPRLKQVVVLLTPPLLLNMAMIFATRSPRVVGAVAVAHYRQSSTCVRPIPSADPTCRTSVVVRTATPVAAGRGRRSLRSHSWHPRPPPPRTQGHEQALRLRDAPSHPSTWASQGETSAKVVRPVGRSTLHRVARAHLHGVQVDGKRDARTDAK